MGLIQNIRRVGKIWGNLRGFGSKKNLVNIIRNNSVLTGVRNLKNIQDTIPPEIKEKAKIANQSYKTPEEREREINGWELIPEYSDNELAVYKKGDKIKFSHRGTAGLKDVSTDTFIVNNNLSESERYKQTKEKVERVMNDFKDAKFSHTGHSLGGQLAKTLGNEFKHKSSGFNSGSSTKRTTNPLHKENVIAGDIISNSQILQDKNIQVYKKPEDTKSAHTLKNFLE